MGATHILQLCPELLSLANCISALLFGLAVVLFQSTVSLPQLGLCAFLGSNLDGELALLLSKLSLMLVADRGNRELLLRCVGVLQEQGENTPEGSEDAGLGTVALLPSLCICSTCTSTRWPHRTLSWLVTCSEFGGVALLLNHFVNLMIETHSGSKQAPVELVDPFVGNTSGK